MTAFLNIKLNHERQDVRAQRNDMHENGYQNEAGNWSNYYLMTNSHQVNFYIRYILNWGNL